MGDPVSWILTIIVLISTYIFHKWDNTARFKFKPEIKSQNGTFFPAFYLKCENKDIPNPMYDIKIFNEKGKIIYHKEDINLPIPPKISREYILEKGIETLADKIFFPPNDPNELDLGKHFKVVITIKSNKEEILKKEISCRVIDSRYDVIKISPKKWYEYFDHIL